MNPLQPAVGVRQITEILFSLAFSPDGQLPSPESIDGHMRVGHNFKKLIRQGCLAYLAHIRDVGIEALSIESILVVSEFREVFPSDLPGMPPYRDIDFCIDLEPGTHLISIPPYRMVLVELRELKAQIQELRIYSS
ncbi:hypothetical protein MTR67_044444 [Solanum verrucosum]|uniref:Uncharacterized protein n=1 Tax=Solanum verrucosum TaxID=315347 RepID=A0AAF0UTH3_SOLVR|nr:hypothetical protein MTR67_044444 [Solanum verrucosum]